MFVLRSTSVSWVNALWHTSTWTSQCLVPLDDFPFSSEYDFHHVFYLLKCCLSTTANATLRASASPAAQSVIFTASKQVRNKSFISYRIWDVTFIMLWWVMCFQVKAPGTTTTVYENWKQYSNRTSPNYGIIPKYARNIPHGLTLYFNTRWLFSILFIVFSVWASWQEQEVIMQLLCTTLE